MLKGKSFVFIVLAAILFVMSAIPAAAADGRQVEIRVKVGSTQMKVNGETVKIAAPYKSGSTVMVPLSVFTNAKGLAAKLQLKNNKVITLTYLKQVLVMTIGSKSATLNGKKLELPVAPAVKAGTTTVPLSIVTKSLGAKLSTDTATKELVIKATVPATASSDPIGDALSINSDAGKSKIGDSYFKWSMNYPTGLVQSDSSPDGDRVIFRDVKEEYFLGIYVEEELDALTTDEKRKIINEYIYADEKTVDKKTIKTIDNTYERIVTKNAASFFYEYRGVQANGFFYVLVFGKKAKAASELDRFAGLLNSFKTSFNSNDRSLKDLTQIIEGFKTFTDEDYGLNVKLPKEWKRDEEYAYPWYEADDAYVFVTVSSLEQGDTVNAWIDRRKQRISETFVPTHIKETELSDVIWNGVPAKMLKLSYTWDSKVWWEEYEIFAIQGEYRYYTEIAYSEKEKVKYPNLLDIVLTKTELDFKTVEDNFGFIPDEKDQADRTTKITKTSRKYGYSVTLPEYWTALDNDFEADSIGYGSNGGYLAISIVEDIPDWETAIPEIDKSYNDNMAANPLYKVQENTMVTFAGVRAKKVVIEDSTNKDVYPLRTTMYYFGKGETLYIVAMSTMLANATEFNTKELEAAVNSFTFTS